MGEVIYDDLVTAAQRLEKGAAEVNRSQARDLASDLLGLLGLNAREDPDAVLEFLEECAIRLELAHDGDPLLSLV